MGWYSNQKLIVCQTKDDIPEANEENYKSGTAILYNDKIYWCLKNYDKTEEFPDDYYWAFIER